MYLIYLKVSIDIFEAINCKHHIHNGHILNPEKGKFIGLHIAISSKPNTSA